MGILVKMGVGWDLFYRFWLWAEIGKMGRGYRKWLWAEIGNVGAWGKEKGG
jgi:hypothetical protein